MTVFRFRLETVLKLRQSDRQAKRSELAKALEAERLLQQQADGLTAELSGVKEQYRQSACPGAVDVDRLLELQRYALHLIAQSKLLAQRQASVREEVERRRQTLVEADRQVQVLEKLREKQRAVFLHDLLKHEQKELDEIGSRIHQARGSDRRTRERA